MGGLPGALAICPCGVELDNVSRLTGIFPAGAGGTRGTPGEGWPLSREFLRWEHLRSTSSFLREVVSLP